MRAEWEVRRRIEETESLRGRTKIERRCAPLFSDLKKDRTSGRTFSSSSHSEVRSSGVGLSVGAVNNIQSSYHLFIYGFRKSCLRGWSVVVSSGGASAPGRCHSPPLHQEQELELLLLRVQLGEFGAIIFMPMRILFDAAHAPRPPFCGNKRKFLPCLRCNATERWKISLTPPT